MANFPFPTDWPFNVQGVRNEVDRLLDRVWHLGLSTAPLDGQDWAPCLDVYEEPDRYVIRAELPGLAAEDVSVEILGQTLTIRGFKAEPPRLAAGGKPPATGAAAPGVAGSVSVGGSGGGADATAPSARKLRGECRYGSFARKMELPGPVNETEVSASCRNGVLEVCVSRAPSGLGKSVKVAAG